MPPLPINNPSAPPTNGTVANLQGANIAGSVVNLHTPFPKMGLPAPQAPQPTPAPVAPVAQQNTAPVNPTPIGSGTPVGGQTGAPVVPQGLDPKAFILTKAIAMQEGGGQILPPTAASGDSGALPNGQAGQGGGTYQFTPATWANYAQQVLGNPNAPMTQANQNQVAYTKIKQFLDAGYTPAQASSMWNAGEGSPNSYLPGTVQKNGNTPLYAKNVQKYAEQLWNGQTTGIAPAQTTVASPSIQGFLGNVIGSGASFLGNVGAALMHPINTVQNLASVPVGALQELGGESTPQTAVFDAVKNSFANRYGSPQQIASSLYTDPVGVLADLSALAGGVGLVAGAAGKLADVAKLGNLATAGDAAARAGIDFTVGADGVVTPTVAATEGAGVAGAAQQVSQTLSKISNLSNPLAPIAKGIGALASKTEHVVAPLAEQALGINANDVSTIMRYPEQFTGEQMAKVSRAGLADEVAGAFKERMAALSDTGSAYDPIKADTAPIKVSPTFLEDQLRKTAKVNINDGQISATADSVARSSTEIAKLQQTYDFWKPTFQSGEMTPNQFLNFRKDVNSNLARFEGSPIKNATLSNIGKQIYHNANAEYRPQIANLENIDSSFSAQQTELNTLKKGLFDKNGNLLDTAINKIANAANKGNDKTLTRLEQLFPGISQRIQVLRTVENLQSLAGPKVGTYGRSIFGAVRLGGYAFGAATGNLHVLGGALALEAIQNPSVAVPIIRAIAKINPEIVHATIANMTRYVVMGSSSLNASSQQITANPQSPSVDQGQVAQTPSSNSSSNVNPSPSGVVSQTIPQVGNSQSVSSNTSTTNPSDLQSLATQKGVDNFAIQKSLDAGYSTQEITAQLNTLPNK